MLLVLIAQTASTLCTSRLTTSDLDKIRGPRLLSISISCSCLEFIEMWIDIETKAYKYFANTTASGL